MTGSRRTSGVRHPSREGAFFVVFFLVRDKFFSLTPHKPGCRSLRSLIQYVDDLITNNGSWVKNILNAILWGRSSLRSKTPVP